MTSRAHEQELFRGSEPASSQHRWGWPGATSTPPSATRPADYIVLESVFLSGLVGVIVLARRREQEGSPTLTGRDLPVVAMATFALADVLAKERVSTWLREPFVREDADHKPIEPEGAGLRHAIGELLTCTRCVGTWSALALVGLWTASPAAGRTTANVLALSGVNDLLQSGFRLLAERTNLAIVETDKARRGSS